MTATVNATTAWLARLLVDVAPDSSTVLRIYASNPQAPVLGDIQYPLTATTGSVVVVSASASNPASGVQAVQLNWSFGGGSYGLTEMERLDATHYRFYTVFDFAGVVRLQIVAWDYSGLRTATQFYSFEVTSTATSPPELPWPLIVTGAVIAVAVVVVVVYLFRRRSSASKRTR